MERDEKFVALISGRDWFDASCIHIAVFKEVNLKEEHVKYSKWYEEVYRPTIKAEEGRPFDERSGIAYMSFEQWLIKNCGARELTDEEFEIFGGD